MTETEMGRHETKVGGARGFTKRAETSSSDVSENRLRYAQEVWKNSDQIQQSIYPTR